MRPQTRKLIRLVADDLNDAIFSALQGHPQTAGNLAAHLDVAEKTLYRHLDELVEEELLDCETSPLSRGKAGRRPRTYRIADQALADFRNAANVFGLAHADRLKRGVEEEIRAERERQIRPAEEGST
jgi:predicted ArsR family transcriptional regulator